MTTLYTEIGELVTNDPSVGDETVLGLLRDAAILVDDDRIVWVGATAVRPLRPIAGSTAEAPP